MPRWVSKLLDKFSEARTGTRDSGHLPKSRASLAQHNPPLQSADSSIFRQCKDLGHVGPLPEFQYHPLPTTGSFRVLQLITKPDGQPSWDLINVSLDLPPVYTTISYTWDSVEIISSISFKDGQRFPLTDTLSTMLAALEEKAKSERLSLFSVWIDAICINQLDNSEKGLQVQMMRDIYMNSQKTLIWLGYISDNSSRVADTILRMKELFSRRPVISGDPNYASEIVKDEPWLRDLDDQLDDLFKRKWFSRVWIIQEVACSDQVEFMWSNKVMSWDDVQFATTSFSNFGIFLPPAARLGMGNQGYIDGMRRVFRNDGSLNPIQVLWWSQNFYATEPLDKIYALFGLIPEVYRNAIAVDYGWNVRDLFVQVASTLLTMNVGGRDINMLAAAGLGFNRQVEDLPSWVPDWTIREKPLSLTMTVFLAPGPHFHAAPASKVVGRVGPLPDSIIMDGIIIDTISRRSGIRPKALFLSEEGNWYMQEELYASILKYVDECFDLIRSVVPYHTGQHVDEVLCRTLIGNTTTDNQLATSEYEILFQDFYSFLSPRYDSSSLAPEWRPTPLEFMTNKFRKVYNFLDKSRVFITPRGLAGLGNHALEEGDVVALILGTCVPYILRPVASGTSTTRQYQLVGECYVHGIMNGEGMHFGPVEDIMLV